MQTKDDSLQLHEGEFPGQNSIFSTLGKRGFLATVDLMYSCRAHLQARGGEDNASNIALVKFLSYAFAACASYLVPDKLAGRKVSNAASSTNYYIIDDALYSQALRVLSDLLNRTLCQGGHCVRETQYLRDTAYPYCHWVKGVRIPPRIPYCVEKKS